MTTHTLTTHDLKPGDIAHIAGTWRTITHTTPRGWTETILTLDNEIRAIYPTNHTFTTIIGGNQ